MLNNIVNNIKQCGQCEVEDMTLNVMAYSYTLSFL